MTFIRQSAIARTLITAIAKAADSLGVAIDTLATRLYWVGRPLEDE